MIKISKNIQSVLLSPIFWGAMAVISAGIIAFAMMSAFKPKFDDVHTEMSELANRIRNKYSQRADYWGLNTDQLLNEKTAPTNMLRKNQIMSSLGREIIVGSTPEGDTVMPGMRTFMLTIKQLSRATCLELAKSLTSAKSDPALEAVVINNGQESREFGWSGSESFDFPIQNATDICRNNNTFSWIYH